MPIVSMKQHAVHVHLPSRPVSKETDVGRKEESLERRETELCEEMRWRLRRLPTCCRSTTSSLPTPVKMLHMPTRRCLPLPPVDVDDEDVVEAFDRLLSISDETDSVVMATFISIQLLSFLRQRITLTNTRLSFLMHLNDVITNCVTHL